MAKNFEITQDILEAAGFEVSEDNDQPGKYVWVRRLEGGICDGCDASFESEEQAWEQLREIFAVILEEDFELTPEEWATKTAEERMSIAMES